MGRGEGACTICKGSVSRIYKRWRNIGLHYNRIVEKMNLPVINEKLETCNNRIKGVAIDTAGSNQTEVYPRGAETPRAP